LKANIEELDYEAEINRGLDMIQRILPQANLRHKIKPNFITFKAIQRFDPRSQFNELLTDQN
jgi:hypothetical protein